MEEITQNIQGYFQDFFTDIKVYAGFVMGRDAITFDGYRNGNKYSFSTNQVIGNGPMLFHWLESIKGEIVKGEQIILLEKNKNSMPMPDKVKLAYDNLVAVINDGVEDGLKAVARFSRMPVTFSQDQINTIKKISNKK